LQRKGNRNEKKLSAGFYNLQRKGNRNEKKLSAGFYNLQRKENCNEKTVVNNLAAIILQKNKRKATAK